MLMDLSSLITFNAVLIASIVSPGPAFLLALRSTLVHGRAAGLRVGLGLALMASLWTAMALAGIEIVFKLFPWAYTALKIGGAAYLFWIAVQMWRGAKRPLSSDAEAKNGILSGIMVNLGNPKSVIFAASVLVLVFPAPLSTTTKVLLTLNHLALELMFYGVLAFALSRPSAQRAYLGAKPIFDRIAATLLGLLGLRLLLQKG